MLKKIKNLLFIILLSYSNINTFTYAQNNITELTVPKGKSVLILKDELIDKNGIWQCDNPNIVDIEGNVLFAKNIGQTNIAFKTAEETIPCYKITVTEPEGIKFSYASRSMPEVNSTISLYAITDQSIENVRFCTETQQYYPTSKVPEYDTIVWQTELYITKKAPINISIEYCRNNEWKKSNQTIKIFNLLDETKSSSFKKSVSYNCVNFITRYEGYHRDLKRDTLAAKRVYDIGYGVVILPDTPFYNNITPTEAKALLLEKLFYGPCAEKVNNFLIENNIKFNQEQFDSLVSFSYNVGIKWMENSDLKKIILDCKSVCPQIFAKVNYKSGINIREEPRLSGEIIKAIPYGEKIKVLSPQKYNTDWYHIETSSGISGFCFAEGIYITYEGEKTGESLDDIDREKFVNEFLCWCHANRKFLRGLLNRRKDELKIFFFGDYQCDGSLNKYGFDIPQNIKDEMAAS